VRAVLELSAEVYTAILKHLLRANPKSEEAGFCFAERTAPERFKLLEWSLVASDEFAYRSLYHIELTDHCRAKVIKRAHDLKASLIEFHSHPLSQQVEFSSSDQSGFAEFVPYVWWRLKGRPYAAVVVGRSSFDSLIWTADPSEPDGVLLLKAGTRMLEPTGRTMSYREDYESREV